MVPAGPSAEDSTDVSAVSEQPAAVNKRAVATTSQESNRGPLLATPSDRLREEELIAAAMVKT